MFSFGYFHTGESVREKNILGKSCTTFVIVKIVRNLSRGRSPCQRVNHVKSGVIYFSAFIYSCIRYYSYVEPGPNIIEHGSLPNCTTLIWFNGGKAFYLVQFS